MLSWYILYLSYNFYLIFIIWLWCSYWWVHCSIGFFSSVSTSTSSSTHLKIIIITILIMIIIITFSIIIMIIITFSIIVIIITRPRPVGPRWIVGRFTFSWINFSCGAQLKGKFPSQLSALFLMKLFKLPNMLVLVCQFPFPCLVCPS